MEDGTRMAVVDRVSRSAQAHPGRAGWVIAGGSAAVLAVLFAWPATRSALTSADPTNIDPLAAFALGFGLVGALILSRVGSNALGWVYVGAGGLAGAVTLALLAYARVGPAAHPGSLPGALAVGWVSSWIGTLCFNPLMTYGLLLFPDGRLPSGTGGGSPGRRPLRSPCWPGRMRLPLAHSPSSRRAPTHWPCRCRQQCSGWPAAWAGHCSWPAAPAPSRR
jgi:hypothetical protein